MISGSNEESPGSPMTSGCQTQSQDLNENLWVTLRPPGPKYKLMIYENLWVPRRPLGPYATSGLRKRSPDSKSPYSKKLETSGFRAHPSGLSCNLRVPRRFSGPCIISRILLSNLRRG
ncbi:hypothetical protein F2Q69_00036270 [Brassica cretica]|uniref:Uncharacterized protein n=1 Tax=Brassica cretica TaxID=69181 RepID=A0A8S9SJE0_BRACR|nr:hypothetical protein F2Q69_00036270 [Brassica cretica]